MIAKNEMEHISRALESVKDTDEIIVCDTGSTDGGGTVTIAKQFTDKVYEDYKWEDSFCKARNHAKSKATGDWILSLDCDEFIHDFSKVRETVDEAERMGIQSVDILQISESDGQLNTFPRLFKNSPGITWHGDAHNYINVLGTLIYDDNGIKTANAPYTKQQQEKSLVKLTYGYSLAHLSDPDRTLRILEKCANDGRAGARELYYLGREYYYRQRYSECTAVLGRYVQISRFPAEKSDAFLMMARCYWGMRMSSDARDACAQAIIINPDFKEALLFMSELSWPRQGARWKSFSDIATNEDVLFVRTK